MLKGPDYEDDIERYAPRFELFFGHLRLLLSDNVEAPDRLPTAELSLQVDTPIFSPGKLPSNVAPFTTDTRKRPNSLTITSPSKVRPRSSEHNEAPQTPDQPTIFKNPAFSGDSIESTDEDNTKRMIGTLIDTALLSLRSDFVRIPWTKYARNCRLRSSGYFHLLTLLTNRQERLRFILGKKSIIAINDGSIIIEYSRSSNRIATWGINDRSRKIRPVVSIEVFSPFNPPWIIGKTKTWKRSSSRLASCGSNILWNARTNMSSWNLFPSSRYISRGIVISRFSYLITGICNSCTTYHCSIILL
jgi:hypothetical protein